MADGRDWSIQVEEWVHPKDQAALKASVEAALCELMELCPQENGESLVRSEAQDSPVALVVTNSPAALDDPTLEVTITLFERPESVQILLDSLYSAITLFLLVRRDMGGDCYVPRIFLRIPTKPAKPVKGGEQ